MIHISNSSLESLAETLSVANTPTFLWRKLSSSSAVESLSTNESYERLTEALSEILSEKNLVEDENRLALAYALMVALIAKSPLHVGEISKIEGIEKLYWARQLLEYKAGASETTRVSLIQSPQLHQLGTDAPVSGNQTTPQIIIINS